MAESKDDWQGVDRELREKASGWTGGVVESMTYALNAAEQIASLRAELAAVKAERDRLAEFKAYIHRRLDEAGVPADPDSPHKAQGCRIGGRLDIVLGERDRLRSEVEQLRAACKAVSDSFVYLPAECGHKDCERCAAVAACRQALPPGGAGAAGAGT
jgi:hypothetical protein